MKLALVIMGITLGFVSLLQQQQINSLRSLVYSNFRATIRIDSSMSTQLDFDKITLQKFKECQKAFNDCKEADSVLASRIK